MENKYVKICNYKFVLQPGEERKIKISYQATDAHMLVLPGALRVY